MSKAKCRGKKPGTPRPITIRGYQFKSLSEAARALGVHFSTVERAAMRGQEAIDALLDLPPGETFRPATQDWRAPVKGNPISILGKSFRSCAAAARALGVEYHIVWNASLNGQAQLDALGEKHRTALDQTGTSAPHPIVAHRGRALPTEPMGQPARDWRPASARETGLMVGDVVTLTTGGQRMTITGHDCTEAECAWFDGATLQREFLPLAALIVTEADHVPF